jgi:small subunit ribosomal protein S3
VYKENVAQDLIIKKFVKKAFRPAGLEDVIVRRNGNMIEVEVSVARPGVAIGREEKELRMLKKELALMIKKAVEVKISEVKKADVSAAIIARSIAEGVERRQPPKLLMASHKEKAMAAGAKVLRFGFLEESVVQVKQEL